MTQTDAQGISFGCIILVVICNVGFFDSAAILAGVNVGGEEKGGGLWTEVFLVGMVIALGTQIAVLSWGGGCEKKEVKKSRT